MRGRGVSLWADDAAARLGYFRVIRPPRNDLLLAFALAVPSVVQVLVWPLVSPPVLGVGLALLVTLPIAWRRVHPALAPVIGTLPWYVPTDGYVVVGFVAAFVLFYSLGAHVPGQRRVLAIAAYGVALSLFGSWINNEVAGEYMAAVVAVVLPTLAGRIIRREREQTLQLEALAAELRQHEREPRSRPCAPRAGQARAARPRAGRGARVRIGARLPRRRFPRIAVG